MNLRRNPKRTLFLPGSVVSAENLGTFSDYHFTNTQDTRIVLINGRAYTADDADTQAGAFAVQVWHYTGPNRVVGSCIMIIMDGLTIRI